MIKIATVRVVITYHLYLRQIMCLKVLYGEVNARKEVSGRLKLKKQLNEYFLN